MKRILPYFLKYLPRRGISKIVGKISSYNNIRFQRWLIDWFIAHHKVNIDEMLYPKDHYKTLSEFFLRELRPECRRVEDDTIVSPVDGVITECGIVENNLIECKGERLSIKDIVADDEFFDDLKDAYFTIHYLSPRDYHWIHSPVDGEIYKIRKLRGDLYPVFDEMISHKKEILCINERLNVFIRNGGFRICLSMIAAMGVGNIIPSERISSISSSEDLVDLRENPLRIFRGEKLGAFALGSTVVLVFNQYRPNFNLKGKYITFGTGIIKV